jgi:hypothetical protein
MGNQRHWGARYEIAQPLRCVGWARHRPYGTAVAVDANGFIHVTGASEGAFDGHLNTSLGSRDALVMKLSHAGETRSCSVRPRQPAMDAMHKSPNIQR